LLAFTPETAFTVIRGLGIEIHGQLLSDFMLEYGVWLHALELNAP
jgi:hypothetical protein